MCWIWNPLSLFPYQQMSRDSQLFTNYCQSIIKGRLTKDTSIKLWIFLCFSDDALDHFSDIPLTSNGKYFLDFGRYNVIGHPISLTLKAINTSAIPTSLDAHVSLFPAAVPPQPGILLESTLSFMLL